MVFSIASTGALPPPASALRASVVYNRSSSFTADIVRASYAPRLSGPLTTAHRYLSMSPTEESLGFLATRRRMNGCGYAAAWCCSGAMQMTATSDSVICFILLA
ncbi:unnamed protein product [Ectocarpus sp. 4 AP-2014]